VLIGGETEERRHDKQSDVRTTLRGHFRTCHKNAIAVGVEPIAVVDHGSCNAHGDVLLANALLGWPHRAGVESSDANVAEVDIVDVPDAAVDNNADPPIVLRLLREVAADDGPPQAPAAVDHEDPAMAFLLEELVDQDVVLDGLDCHHSARENLAPSVDLEDRRERTELAICKQMRISITYICSGQ